MVTVLNSAYTGPLPSYLWCSSGAVLRSRSEYGETGPSYANACDDTKTDLPS